MPTPPPTIRPDTLTSVAPAAIARAARSSSIRKVRSRVKGLTPNLRQSSARLRFTPSAPSAACVAPILPSEACLMVLPRRPKNLEAPLGNCCAVRTGSLTASLTLSIFSLPDASRALPNSADLFMRRSESMACISLMRLRSDWMPVIVSGPSGPSKVKVACSPSASASGAICGAPLARVFSGSKGAAATAPGRS